MNSENGSQQSFQTSLEELFRIRYTFHFHGAQDTLRVNFESLPKKSGGVTTRLFGDGSNGKKFVSLCESLFPQSLTPPVRRTSDANSRLWSRLVALMYGSCVVALLRCRPKLFFPVPANNVLITLHFTLCNHIFQVASRCRLVIISSQKRKTTVCLVILLQLALRISLQPQSTNDQTQTTHPQPTLRKLSCPFSWPANQHNPSISSLLQDQHHAP